MDKCPKCGNKLSSIDVLCPRCGTLVEVVQVKKSAGVQSASGTYGSAAKKTPQQNLIVYNDDLPSDDIFDSPEPEPEVPDMAEPEPVDLNDTETLSYDLPEPTPELHSEEPEVGSEADYLALLKKMNLSALDDLEEPTSSYSDGSPEPMFSTGNEIDDSASPIQYKEPEPTPSTDVPHRWLEIEELPDTEEDEPQPIPMVESAPQPIPMVESAPPPPPIFMSSEEQRRYHARNGRDKKSAHRSAGRVVLMIFVWLVITCAVFCGFYFFDQYVIGHYGSYQAMMHEISGGQIELGTSADAVPNTSESP